MGNFTDYLGKGEANRDMTRNRGGNEPLEVGGLSVWNVEEEAVGRRAEQIHALRDKTKEGRLTAGKVEERETWT